MISGAAGPRSRVTGHGRGRKPLGTAEDGSYGRPQASLVEDESLTPPPVEDGSHRALVRTDATGR
jgi:hypothetical protein